MSKQPLSNPKKVILTLVLVIPVVFFVAYISLESRPVKEEKGDINTIGDIESGIEKVIKKNYDESFAMSDDFFGKKNQEAEKIEEVEEEPVIEKYQEPEKTKIVPKQIFVQPQEIAPKQYVPTLPALSKKDSEVISYEEINKKDSPLNLMADKDYPKTIASNAYDLSRILTTDSFIPAVMYTAINSEIPSKTVLAIVESDVVGFHGNNILIPKGSKLEGVYEAIDDKHARRMQITWFKITRPDGIMIKLDAESADSQGASGVTGYLDQRLKDRYGGALLLSTINALAQLSINEDDIRQLAAVESFGREFGTLTAQIVRENMNAMPIIMIRQGTRFNIRPYQNIYFREPEKQIINTLFVNS